MTPKEFYNWVQGRFDSEFEQFKREAELHRMFTLRLVNTQMGKSQIKDPKKIIKFAWEAEKVVKLTAEQIEYLKNW
jgi:hypothetical protein